MCVTDLEYEAAHPGAGRQHEEDVREEHEVTLALLLTDRTEDRERKRKRKKENDTPVCISALYYGKIRVRASSDSQRDKNISDRQRKVSVNFW